MSDGNATLVRIIMCVMFRQIPTKCLIILAFSGLNASFNVKMLLPKLIFPSDDNELG